MAGGGGSCPHSPDLANLFCKAPTSGGQLLFHTCPEPLKNWRPQSDSIDSTNQDKYLALKDTNFDQSGQAKLSRAPKMS